MGLAVLLPVCFISSLFCARRTIDFDEPWSNILSPLLPLLLLQPHGRAWKIIDKRLFMSTAMPYFHQSKYEHFTRQLSGWGFKRLHREGGDSGAYYHQCFLRGLPHVSSGGGVMVCSIDTS